MDNKLQFTGSSEEEYTTQLFGFGTHKFKKGIRDMVEYNICSNLEQFEEHINDQIKPSAEEKESIKTFFLKIRDSFFKKAISSFEVIDAEIDEMFKIPAHVLLPEDEDTTTTTVEEYNNVQNEISDLQKKLKRYMTLKHLLTQEYKELEAAMKVAEITKKSMETLDLLYENCNSCMCEIKDEAIKTSKCYLEYMKTVTGDTKSDNCKMELEDDFDIFNTEHDLPSTSKYNLKKIKEVKLENAISANNNEPSTSDASIKTEKDPNYLKIVMKNEVSDLDNSKTTGTKVIPNIKVEDYSDAKNEPDKQVILNDKNYLCVPRKGRKGK